MQNWGSGLKGRSPRDFDRPHPGNGHTRGREVAAPAEQAEHYTHAGARAPALLGANLANLAGSGPAACTASTDQDRLPAS